MARVTVDEQRVHIHDLTCEDSTLAGLLARQPAELHSETVRRALAVGARGLVTMGVGLDLGEMDQRVRRSVDEALEEAMRLVQQVVEEARRSLTDSLDPDQRSSIIARASAELTSWREGFLRSVDPASADSHTGRLVRHLEQLLGPGGQLERRLTEALDPHADGSGLAQLAASLDQRLTELRDLVAEQRGARREAERGTAKGVEYEDAVEEALRAAARAMGAVVERTTRTPGALAGDALVGDYVLTLPEGWRVVVEAKNVRSLSLTGGDGILAELDRAMANRQADAAICVSAGEAFPQEVGPFGVYGKRVLVVDDGDGTMLWVALRWTLASLAASGRTTVETDPELVTDRLQRIRQLCQLFSTNRRTLTEIVGSVERVRGSLEQMRSDLLGLVDDLAAELGRGRQGAVVEMRRQAG